MAHVDVVEHGSFSQLDEKAREAEETGTHKMKFMYIGLRFATPRPVGRADLRQRKQEQRQRKSSKQRKSNQISNITCTNQTHSPLGMASQGTNSSNCERKWDNKLMKDSFKSTPGLLPLQVDPCTAQTGCNDLPKVMDGLYFGSTSYRKDKSNDWCDFQTLSGHIRTTAACCVCRWRSDKMEETWRNCRPPHQPRDVTRRLSVEMRTGGLVVLDRSGRRLHSNT